MELTTFMPWIVGVAVVTLLMLATAAAGQRRSHVWLLPAAASLAFLSWTLWAVTTEGPLGFWTEHTRNKWGNQIWFDLLFAVAIGWWLILPRARRAGLQVWIWLPIVVLTGCIGFLAMLARLLYCEEGRGKT
jgi:hypothetical protein